jgi:hypothetical protein
VRKIWENNGEEIHNGDPYSADNQVLPQEALFYYEMVIPGEGGARAPYELWLADPDADLSPNQATFEEMLDADPLAERLNTVMWHYVRSTLTRNPNHAGFKRERRSPSPLRSHTVRVRHRRRGVVLGAVFHLDELPLPRLLRAGRRQQAGGEQRR